MASERPDPKSVADPDCLLLEDDKITFEISKKYDHEAKKEQAGPPEDSPSSSVTEDPGSENLEADDDGFRTPVRVNHRIPVITECPPAPKKTRVPLRKRKALNSPRAASRKRIQINLSKEEFEALFAHDSHGEIKKASPDGAV